MNPSKHVPVVHYAPLTPLKARKVGLLEPFEWLAAGWKSFWAVKSYALLFGVVFAISGASISYASLGHPQLIFAFWSGFVLIAPGLAMVLYHMAQRHDEGKPLSLVRCGDLFRQNLGNSLLLALFLAILMIVWIRVSTLVAAMYAVGMPGMVDISGAFLSMDNIGMLLTLGGVGAVFALIVFALFAWSMPMLARGRENFATAIVSSVHAVFSQPAPMLLWGVIVAVLTILSMATFFVAFAVVFPWLGFATWEAYKRVFESA